MRKMKVLLRQGEIIPKTYRVAYYDFTGDFAICYPAGIHLLVRLARRIWEWSFKYNPSKLEMQMREQYKNGQLYGRRQVEEFYEFAYLAERDNEQNP